MSSPVTYRYARSLMQLASEKGQLEAVREDMLLVNSVTKESRELRRLLHSPVVKAAKKQSILNKIFGGKVGEMTSSFLNILVRKGRESHIVGVSQALLDLYDEANNILKFTVTSAIPLTDEAREKVTAMAVEIRPGMKMELQEVVDPSLIGGVILRLGDQQYDASVTRELQDMRRKFKENPYIPEI